VLALALIPIGLPVFMAPFWCLPGMFLKGPSAAAGIALINTIGTFGGFFGPSIVGVLKQITGTDSGAFLGLASLSVVGAFVCWGLRRAAPFSLRSEANSHLQDHGERRVNES
jgi:ACS family tartrate transporter-like MFS transporter